MTNLGAKIGTEPVLQKIIKICRRRVLKNAIKRVIN